MNPTVLAEIRLEKTIFLDTNALAYRGPESLITSDTDVVLRGAVGVQVGGEDLGGDHFTTGAKAERASGCRGKIPNTKKS
jgi:hypothetical protein